VGVIPIGIGVDRRALARTHCGAIVRMDSSPIGPGSVIFPVGAVQRTLDTLRWGRIPNWPKDPKMKAWPISGRVNSPKNDDAEIIVPIELQSVLRSENQPQLL